MMEMETSLKTHIAMVWCGGDEVLGRRPILGKEARGAKVEA